MNRLHLLGLATALLCLGCSVDSVPATLLNPHPSTWTQDHPASFAKDPSNCPTCHGSTTDPAASGGPARTSCFSCHNHSPNAPCRNCHLVQSGLWASAENLHSVSAADVLTNPDHNSAELLNNDCLKCHSTFQVPLGVAHFVTPVNQVGQPAGTWTVLNPNDWQATRCEVCHDPFATGPAKLAKYGSLLDGTWKAAYLKISELPAAYQTVIDGNGDVSPFLFPDQTTLSAQATRLCNSCHDPADQGGDPDVTIDGIDYGPQGGDSRAYVTTSHRGMGCIDCHPGHDYTPVDPRTTPACTGSACHSADRSDMAPGIVHVNHLEDAASTHARHFAHRASTSAPRSRGAARSGRPEVRRTRR